MKATEAKLLDFLRRSSQFVIPIYQRTYSWTAKECRSRRRCPVWRASASWARGRAEQALRVWERSVVRQTDRTNSVLEETKARVSLARHCRRMSFLNEPRARVLCSRTRRCSARAR